MALGGGGSRKRKAARRVRAHESEIMESVAASLGEKVKVTKSIVGPVFSRGECRARLSAGVKKSSAVSNRQGRPSGSIMVHFVCDVGHEQLESRRGYKSVNRAKNALSDFFKHAK